MVTLVQPLNLPAGLLRGSGKTRNGEIENGKREMEKWVEVEFLRCRILFIFVIEEVAEHRFSHDFGG